MAQKHADFFGPENNPYRTDEKKDPNLILPTDRINFDRVSEIQIIFVDDQYGTSFVKESNISGPSQDGKYLTRTVTNVYIDSNTGNPLDIWPGHIKIWVSCSGKYIFNQDKLGECKSMFHTSPNRNVLLDVDGSLSDGECYCNDCLSKKSIIWLAMFSIFLVALTVFLFVR